MVQVSSTGRRGAAIAAVWLALCASGLGSLAVLSHRQGAVATPPAGWPAESAIHREPGKPSLVMFLHPQCACSRTSLGELARLLARHAGQLSATVLFVRPRGAPPGGEKSDTRTQAEAIPGVTVISDPDGVEAARFHGMTSGVTLLFGAGGEALFSGGLTPARAHAGDSAGQDTIEAILAGELARLTTTPVYGCSLAEAPDGGATR